MRPAFVGIDVAIAKGKYLPVSVCTWEEDRLIPQALRRLGLVPPRGSGNAASLDREVLRQFARDTGEYVAKVCDRLRLIPTRIGIDAPSAPRDRAIPRRAAEVALDRAGISCFATPGADDFDLIRVS